MLFILQHGGWSSERRKRVAGDKISEQGGCLGGERGEGCWRPSRENSLRERVEQKSDTLLPTFEEIVLLYRGNRDNILERIIEFHHIISPNKIIHQWMKSA